MAASLQILGSLILGEKPPLAHVDELVRQKVLIAMDCLAGAITYGSPSLLDESDESVRRGFLMSGGRSFMSEERLRRARERAQVAKETRAPDPTGQGPALPPTLPVLPGSA